MARIGELDLFRFTSVAPITDDPTAVVVGGQVPPRYNARTPFHAQVAALNRVAAAQAAGAFLANAIPTNDPTLALVRQGYQAAQNAANLRAWLGGVPAGNAIDAPTFTRVIDAYVAHRIVGSPEVIIRPYANLLRFIAFLDRRALVALPAGATNSIRRFRRLLASIPLLLQDDLLPLLPQRAQIPAPAPAAPGPANNAQPNRPTSARIRRAIQDIHAKELMGAAPRVNEPPRKRDPGDVERFVTRMFGKTAPAPNRPRQPAPRPAPQALGIDNDTRDTLNQLRIDPADPSNLVTAALEHALEHVGRGNRQRAPRRTHTMVGNLAIPTFRLPGPQQPAAGAGPAGAEPLAGLPPQRPVVRFGELHVVRTQLIGYELAKFSHIENVMAGETRLREHRSRRVVEEQTRLLTVVEEERESDLQKTDKNTMQSEMARSTSMQLNAEAGMTVSGNYGPSTEYTAQASVGLSMATETSSRTASTVAREVTERTVQRVRERREEEIIRRRVQEDEELNRHGFQGANAHLRGIYRWVNEVHRAQVYCIGERYYLELVVPEPGANFLRLVAQGLVPGDDLPPKPDEIELDASSEDWDDRWAELGDLYNVNVPPPPPQNQWIAATVSGTPDSAEDYRFCSAEKLVIPAGYEAATGEIAISKRENDSDRYWVTVYLGGVYFRKDDNHDYPGDAVTMKKQRGEMTFSVNARDCKSITVTADVKCTVTNERMAEWRAEAYDAVLQGYRAQKIAWEEGLRAAKERAQELAEDAHNRPRRIDVSKTIREETQRAFLSVLLGHDMVGFDTLLPQQLQNAERVYWRYDYARVAQVAPRLAFLQQAFEWRNMNVVFYPYFWGGQPRWQRTFDGTGAEDPAFGEFLSAGAARIQVPIRPEMAVAVARELNLEGIDLSLPASGVVDIMQERLEAADHPDNAEAVGDPWEFTLPTDLAILEREDNNIPFRDPLRLAANHVQGGDGIVALGAAAPAAAPAGAQPALGAGAPQPALPPGNPVAPAANPQPAPV